MATQKTVLTKSWPAGENLSERQFRAVYLDGGTLKAAGTANRRAIGILQDNPALGEAGKVMMLGISKAEINGNSENVGVGDLLTMAANGVLIKSEAAGDSVVAVALEAVTADGVIAEVLVTPGGGFIDIS